MNAIQSTGVGLLDVSSEELIPGSMLFQRQE